MPTAYHPTKRGVGPSWEVPPGQAPTMFERTCVASPQRPSRPDGLADARQVMIVMLCHEQGQIHWAHVLIEPGMEGVKKLLLVVEGFEP